MQKPHLSTKIIPVTGMTCASCAGSVESMIKSVKGVSIAVVNLAANSVKVSFDSDITNANEMQKAIRAIGYDLIIKEESNTEEEERTRAQYLALRKRTILAGVLALPVFILGMFFMHWTPGHYISMALTALIMVTAGRDFYIRAFKQALRFQTSMDTLVALSTLIAFLFSTFNVFFHDFWMKRGLDSHIYFESSAVIIFFISLGKLLEEGAKAGTSAALKKLMGLQQETVRVLRENSEQEIPFEAVEVDDIVILRAGDRVPVDGIVVDGNSFVDESSITGEPVPKEKHPGEKVFSGSMNQSGNLRFKAEKVGSETLLARIITRVREAQGSKAPAQKLADKIAGVFVPVVLGISIITFIAWMIFGKQHALEYGILSAVTVLVIACPCALGLATPTAIMVGIGKGAENHILIRDAESLERAHKITDIVLDKTGTLTEGKPSIKTIWWNPEAASKELPEKIFFSLEQASSHPLAKAVCQHLEEAGIGTGPLLNVKEEPGRGLWAESNFMVYRAGSLRWMKEEKVSIPDETDSVIQQLSREGNTLVFFSENKKILAIAAITDKIRKGAAEMVGRFQEDGIQVHLLTGDNGNAADVVATELGITSVRANVLPEGKFDFIKELQTKGKVVAMVGDGINDSEALAVADISVAMGMGSDVAKEIARMTLVNSDPASLPKAIELSKQTVQTLRQNLFWAFIYNLVGIPLAAGLFYPFSGILLSPMIAGAAMAMSSVSVVANSLRLKYVKL